MGVRFQSAGQSDRKAAPAHDILADAEWLPHQFDRAGTVLRFVRVPWDDRRRLPFLGAEQLASDFDHVDIALEDIAARLQRVPTSAAPLHFIFHTGFCCSTLIARAIADIGQATVLSEPALPLNLVELMEIGTLGDAQFHASMQLLARPSASRSPVIVKPSCFALPLLPLVLAKAPQSKVVAMSCDLESFLLAVARRGLRGRWWGRRAYAGVARHFPSPFQFGQEEMFEHTDLQVAGLAWLSRRHHLARLARTAGPEKMMVIDQGAFLDHPSATFATVAAFLGLTADRCRNERIATSAIWTSHSKEGRPFDRGRRAAELADTAAIHGEEVEAVRDWVEQVAAFHRISTSLAEPALRLVG